MSTQVKLIQSRIKKDNRLLRLDESFEKFSHFNLPIKQLKNEIEMLHKVRPIRTLKPQGGDFIARVIEASTADQATRSRLSEISLQAFRAQKSLQTALDAIKDHIIVTYSSDLSFFKTKEERARIVDCILAEYRKYIQEVDAIQNMCTLIIKDIDQAAWSLKSTIEALKMLSKPEAMI